MLIFKEPKQPSWVSSIKFLSGTGVLLPDPSMLHYSSCKRLPERIPSSHTACPRAARQAQELPRPSARTQTQIKAPGAKPSQQSYFSLCFCIGCWCWSLLWAVGMTLPHEWGAGLGGTLCMLFRGKGVSENCWSMETAWDLGLDWEKAGMRWKGNLTRSQRKCSIITWKCKKSLI